jgi:hypothetical protein
MPEIRYTGGSRYALRDGPTWTEGDVHDVDGATAERLAGLDKFELADDGSDDASEDGELPDDTVPVDEAMDQGVCPWCDDYEGENVGLHASSAHPDKWEDYNG